jgi:hypothetical protein
MPPGRLARDLPGIFAYVEWFTDPHIAANTTCAMYSVARQIVRGRERLTSVIPVTDVFRSCHLLPVLRKECPPDWTSDTVLDVAPRLFVNSYLDPHMFALTHP